MEGGQTQFMKPPPTQFETMGPPSQNISNADSNETLPNVAMPPPTLSQPPPNILMPPPNMPPPGAPGNYNQRFGTQQFQPRQFFRAFQPFVPRGPIGPMTLEDFDGKRLRKSVMRKTVDYNSSIIEALETRIWHRDYRDRRALQPDVMYYPELLPPPSYPDNAINCVTTRFVKTATNKMRCPIFCMAWTPEGRRLVTGASSGEFTLWNGLTFNFETILQAHDSPVRTMVWSHNDNWMVTGDHAGYVKYWQSNMNNVKMFQAHKEALRGISFSPTDSKFVTCSDDGTLRIWDFLNCHEEHVLRGHGADVKCVQWHPQKSLIISGSKDNQQPIKLWDPKTGQSLATLHAHKSTVMDLKWNDNGNWLITASRDHLLKLFDLRNLNQEVQTFRGHKKEASSVAWHPAHEGLFASGGSDGSIMFWHVGADKEVGAIEQAHDSIVWTLAWHPLGHILCSGSNDHSSKFWTRNRPGDMMRDKYNLNTLPAGLNGFEDLDTDEPSVIPGMGPEDKVETIILPSDSSMAIPGLDLDAPPSNAEDKPNKAKKVPYSKPIPRNFQAQWNDKEDDGPRDTTISEVISHIVENTPGVVPLDKITPSAIIVYGKVLPVEPGSELEKKIIEGPEALKRYIASGAIEELHDVMPHMEDDDLIEDDMSTSLNNVVLPTALASLKLQNLAAIASAIAAQEKGDEKSDSKSGSSKDRPRKSRFSDANEPQNPLVTLIQNLLKAQQSGASGSSKVSVGPSSGGSTNSGNYSNFGGGDHGHDEDDRPKIPSLFDLKPNRPDFRPNFDDEEYSREIMDDSSMDRGMMDRSPKRGRFDYDEFEEDRFQGGGGGGDNFDNDSWQDNNFNDSNFNDNDDNYHDNNDSFNDGFNDNFNDRGNFNDSFGRGPPAMMNFNRGGGANNSGGNGNGGGGGSGGNFRGDFNNDRDNSFRGGRKRNKVGNNRGGFRNRGGNRRSGRGGGRGGPPQRGRNTF